MPSQTTFRPDPFPSPLRRQLVGLLVEAHAEEPFGPRDVRGGARRVVEVVGHLGLDAVVVRGGLDLGGAELDHVFVVVAGRVVDVALPVHDERFLRAVRAWVAGDLGTDQLAAHAAAHGIEERVLGDFPPAVGYRGAPLWGSAA